MTAKPTPASRFNLQPGDVISYSAGSTQTGAEGFRKLGGGANPLAEVLQRRPDIAVHFVNGTVVVVNAYPAALGTFSFGVTIDTYLSPRVLTRALQLAAADQHPTVLTGQPLFLADALLKHLDGGFVLPSTLLLSLGGYAMPAGLEQLLRDLLAPVVEHLFILQFFGAAEVDAGCFMGWSRTAAGEVIYLPRSDVRVALEGDSLAIGLSTALDQPLFATGDQARQEGEGYVIWNDRRLHPEVGAALSAWDDSAWRRRTGYVVRTSDGLAVQLREGVTVVEAGELDFYDFGKHHGFSWLNKPYWR